MNRVISIGNDIFSTHPRIFALLAILFFISAPLLGSRTFVSDPHKNATAETPEKCDAFPDHLESGRDDPLHSIVLNEFMADPGFDFNGDNISDSYDEYIELYNPTGVQVSLENCFLDDIEDGGSSAHSLNGLVIDAYSYLLLFRTETGIALNNNGEERVRLLDPQENDIDNHTFFESKKNRSWARRGDGNETWTMPRENTPGTTNPTIPNIVLNEFLVKPETDSTDEWIELFNSDSRIINITGWKIGDLDNNEFIFPIFTLDPGDYVTLNIGNAGRRGGDERHESGTQFYMANSNQVLTDSGDDIVLYDDIGIAVDYINYGNGSSIDECPDELTFSDPPPIPPKGSTLALIPNGKITDSGLDYEALNGANITKGWNNSLPLALVCPTNIGFDIDETGGEISIPVKNPCISPSVWNADIESKTDSFIITGPENLEVSGREEKTLQLSVVSVGDPLPGTGARITVNLSSSLVSGIGYSMNAYIALRAEVLINEIMIDPQGADSDGDEWIEIINRERSPVNVTGWAIVSGTGNMEDIFLEENLFSFPEYFLLPDQVVLVHSIPDVDESIFSPSAGHFYMNKTNVWTNTRGSVAIISNAFTGADFIRWGETEDPPVLPDTFTGTCQVPKSGESLTRRWYRPDSDDASDFFIPGKSEITPGLDNGHLYSFQVETISRVNVIEPGATGEYDIILHNNGNVTGSFQLNCTWANLDNGRGGKERNEDDWTVECPNSTEIIPPGGAYTIDISITAPETALSLERSGIMFDIEIYPLEDPWRREGFTYMFQMPVIDLALSDLHLEGEWTGVEKIEQGNIIKIRAKLLNHGPLNSTDANVSLYVDDVRKENVVGIKNYQFVPGSLYSSTRNPAFTIDTLLYPGNRTFIMRAELTTEVPDIDMKNNMLNLTLNITPVRISAAEKELLITELYYYSYIEDDLDEYVEIHNPGNVTVDISGWQLANDAASDLDKGIFFPPGTMMQPEQYMVIAKDAVELKRSAGVTADLDSVMGGECADMETEELSWLNFNDHSGQCVLRNGNRIIVDSVVYGNEVLFKYGWNGTGVPRCGKGYLCRRNSMDGVYRDTNASADFNRLKQYALGGSDLPLMNIEHIDVETLYFLPGEAGKILRSCLGNANSEILVLSKRLESSLVYDLLLKAAEREVDVTILLEGKPFGGIDDRQLFITRELDDAGARIYYMDDYLKEEKYNRYSDLGGHYMVIDGKRALLQTAGFDAEGTPGEEMTGVKGMGFVLGMKCASYLREAFFEDLNLSRRDITVYHCNHSRFGELDEDYVFKPAEIEGQIDYELPSTSIPEGCKGVLGLYPDISHVLDTDPEHEKDIMNSAIHAADENIYLLTEDLQTFTGIEIPGSPNLVLPHVNSLLHAAERGVDVRILLDISDSEMLFSEIEDEVNITGPRAAARWIMAEAEKRNIDNIRVGFDFLDGALGISGTLILVDNSTLLASSGGITYEDLYLNREWAMMLAGSDWSGVSDLFRNWWERAVPDGGSTGDEVNPDHRRLLITEVYYNSLVSYKPDQYVKIYNPGSSPVDMSWWRLSDKHTSLNSYEGTLVFPKGTVIGGGETIVVARKAEGYKVLTSDIPDFEYDGDSSTGVPNMLTVKGIPILTTVSDEVFLVHRNGCLVDAVTYGTSEYSGAGWNGTPSPVVATGDLVLRSYDTSAGEFTDTNSSEDFTHLRPYRPGQSAFTSQTFEINGNITTFVSPDCSYEAIISALSSARRTLFINIYQFHNPYLLDLIVNLSKDGVDVKVLIEGGPVGGVTDYQRYVSMMLNDSGAHVRYLISDKSEGLGARYDYDHAKYMVIDNRTLILLSENLVTTGVPVNSSYGNRGWGVVVEDTSLSSYFSEVFFHDFNSRMMDSFRYTENHTAYGEPPEDLDMSYYIRKGDYMPRFDPLTVRGDTTITPVLSPDTSSSPEDSVISMMENANNRIKIEQLDCDIDWYRGKTEFNWSDGDNYYLNFSDGEEHYNLYLKAAIDAARRGVAVKVLLDSAFVWKWNTGEDNSDTVNYINRIAAMEGLDMEANLVALGGSSGRASLEKVHNKGVIVDGEKVLVSSINWGQSSVFKNREAGLIISNPLIASYFEEVFDFDWNLSVFNYVSPYVIYSGNRTLAPGGSTQIRVALTYLNTTMPVTLRFNATMEVTTHLTSCQNGQAVTRQGTVKVGLSHDEMRIYPRENRELDILLEAEEDAVPGTDCHIIVQISIENFTQDFLFFDVNITEKLEKTTVAGEDSFFDTFKNIITIVLVALVVLLVAAGRDVVINWQDKRTGKKGIKVTGGEDENGDVDEPSDTEETEDDTPQASDVPGDDTLQEPVSKVITIELDDENEVSDEDDEPKREELIKNGIDEVGGRQEPG